MRKRPGATKRHNLKLITGNDRAKPPTTDIRIRVKKYSCGAVYCITGLGLPRLRIVRSIGMSSLDASIAELYFNGMISKEDAVAQAAFPDKLERQLVA